MVKVNSVNALRFVVKIVFHERLNLFIKMDNSHIYPLLVFGHGLFKYALLQHIYCMPTIPLISLITDLGSSSPYPAWLKGSLYRQFEQVNICDITHDLSEFDLREAAYLLRNAYWQFPEGTIHVVHVCGLQHANRLLYVQHEKHHFLSFDNGLFHLAFEKIPESFKLLYTLPAGEDTLLCNHTLARAARAIWEHGSLPAELGEPTIKMVERRGLQARGIQGSIKGHVAYVDRYQNLVTNISRDLYDHFIGDKSAEIMFGSFSVSRLHNHYSEVLEGEIACFFNSTGLLEIGINMGRAASLLGMSVDKPVNIIQSGMR